MVKMSGMTAAKLAALSSVERAQLVKSARKELLRAAFGFAEGPDNPAAAQALLVAARVYAAAEQAAVADRDYGKEG